MHTGAHTVKDSDSTAKNIHQDIKFVYYILLLDHNKLNVLLKTFFFFFLHISIFIHLCILFIYYILL